MTRYRMVCPICGWLATFPTRELAEQRAAGHAQIMDWIGRPGHVARVEPSEASEES